MTPYSRNAESAPLDQACFNTRLDNFFSDEAMPPERTADLDAGATAEQIELRKVDEFEGAISVLDDLDNDTIPDAIMARFYVADHSEVAPVEKTYDPVNPACRYSKAFARVRALEARLSDVDPDSAHKVAAELEAAYEAFNVEKERALDDRHRKFHLVDTWRAGEGRETFNASRRTTRDQPNAVLADMTPEERAAHRRAQKAASARKRRAEQAAISPSA